MRRIYLKEAPGIWRDLDLDFGTLAEARTVARAYRQDWPKHVYRIRKVRP